MNIAGYTIAPLETGTIWLDGGAMFGTVPKVLWEKKHACNTTNQIQLAMRGLLVQKGNVNLLVDCGLGDKGGEKFKAMYHVDQKTNSLEASLQAHSLRAQDITDVVISHFHFDHAGGATVRKEDGSYAPTFPNARYWVQKQNLEVAQNPNPRERASYLKENHEALIAHEVLNIIDGPQEILPKVHVKLSYGHTCAQQHVWIEDDQEAVFFGGDLVATPSHVSLPWVQGYDLQPLVAIQEKETFYTQLMQKNGWMFYQHDPHYSFSKIRKNEKGRFEPFDLI